MDYIALGALTVVLGGVLGLLLLGRRKSATHAPAMAASAPRFERAAGNPSRSPSPSRSVRQRNWLVGASTSVKDKAYHVGFRTLTLGRKVGNHIQLFDERVSRVHCRLQGSAQGVTLEDLGSEAGTRVNGQEIAPSTTYTLREGDEISIASHRFIFHEVGEYTKDHATQEAKVAAEAHAAPTEANDLRSVVVNALDQAGGNLEDAASHMGIGLEAFLRLMQRVGIDPNERSHLQTAPRGHRALNSDEPHPDLSS